jgi:hypothetical protein
MMWFSKKIVPKQGFSCPPLAKILVSRLWGVFLSIEGPQDKNTFDKMNPGFASQDEDLVYKQRCRMPKLNSFGSDQAEK